MHSLSQIVQSTKENEEALVKVGRRFRKPIDRSLRGRLRNAIRSLFPEGEFEVKEALFKKLKGLREVFGKRFRREFRECDRFSRLSPKNSSTFQDFSASQQFFH